MSTYGKNTQTPNFVEITKKILNKTWDRTMEISLWDLYDQPKPGEYEQKPEYFLQVRDTDKSRAFIQEIVDIISESEDDSHLDDIVIIRYPDGTFKVIGGTHSAEIRLRTGKLKSNAYVVDFEKDLGGRESNAVDLGNMLNNPEKRQRYVTQEDVKNIYDTHVYENIQAGMEDPQPTQEWLDNLQARYPFVSKRSMGQWKSSNPVFGGRRKAAKSYGPALLETIHETYCSNFKWQNHYILAPRGLRSWDQTTVSTCMNLYVRKNIKDFLVIFYPETAAQTLDLNSGKYPQKIKELYDRYRLLGVNIEVEYLKGS